MYKIIVAGIGTEVGKTIASAILATLLKGSYWKPIECGHSDTACIQSLTNAPIHPPAYSLLAPLSPHHAARLEKQTIEPNKIIPPVTTSPLIIESTGGIFVPINETTLTLDLFQEWNCRWVVVSKHYLGSINHTLLTLDALKKRNIAIAGVIFNGEANLDSENAILQISKIPLLGRLLPEPIINRQTIQRYANQWQLL